MQKHRKLYAFAAILGLITLATMVGTPEVFAFQSWDTQINDGNERFKVLEAFDKDAVLDRETGLVWERAPSTKPTVEWAAASALCYNKIVGGRYGWRLPTVEELTSLIDPAAPAPGPKLTPGHPFIDVQFENAEGPNVGYWSATTLAGATTHAYLVEYGELGPGPHPELKTLQLYYWCVRSGQGYDGQ